MNKRKLTRALTAASVATLGPALYAATTFGSSTNLCTSAPSFWGGATIHSGVCSGFKGTASSGTDAGHKKIVANMDVRAPGFHCSNGGMAFVEGFGLDSSFRNIAACQAADEAADGSSVVGTGTSCDSATYFALKVNCENPCAPGCGFNGSCICGI
jgi:hypothetical protein